METESSLPCSQELATCPIPIQPNPIHNFASYFPKIHSTIIFLSMPRYSPPFRFLDQSFA
jgi:hypothetical protein